MGKIVFFTFSVKLISSERASEEEQNTENRFSMRHVWAELVRPRIHSFSQKKKRLLWYIFLTVL